MWGEVYERNANPASEIPCESEKKFIPTGGKVEGKVLFAGKMASRKDSRRGKKKRRKREDKQRKRHSKPHAPKIKTTLMKTRKRGTRGLKERIGSRRQRDMEGTQEALDLKPNLIPLPDPLPQTSLALPHPALLKVTQPFLSPF